MRNSETKDERRSRLTSVLAEAFIELGYRGATTAALAAKCELRENELYRLWDSKKAMFLCAVKSVYDSTIADWDQFSDSSSSTSMAQRVLDYQAKGHGHAGFYRIVFSGLHETNDADIKASLRRMYRGFHKAIAKMILQHHDMAGTEMTDDFRDRADLSAWALIGLGAIADIDLCIQLTSSGKRERLIRDAGQHLLNLPIQTPKN